MLTSRSFNGAYDDVENKARRVFNNSTWTICVFVLVFFGFIALAKGCG